MWTQYFNFIKLRPGRVIVPFHGEIDFSRDDIPLEICKELYEKGFPYLELTELGKKELYWIKEKLSSPISSSLVSDRRQIANIKNPIQKCHPTSQRRNFGPK